MTRRHLMTREPGLGDDDAVKLAVIQDGREAVPEQTVSLAYRLFDSMTSRGCVSGRGISEVLEKYATGIFKCPWIRRHDGKNNET
jgi:hypothetical protein